ncbi:MAG: Arc family DNA-binding protein [Marinilabiliales bacterium]|nr:Arc family DNA-binding protein [Marinilabiliales bacterium]
MGNKKNFVLRLQPEVYDALERWATDEFRSVNGQMEYLLHQALKSSGRLPSRAKENGQPMQDTGDEAEY